MSNDKNQITSKQFMVFITSTQIGIGLLTLPEILVRSVGHDAWITVLLSGIAVMLASVLLLLFMRRYSNKSIYNINKFIYGKYLGSLFNILIFAYFFYASVVGLRLIADVVNITVLKLTPSLVLTVFVLIPSLYLVPSGLKNICRFSSINFIAHGFVVIFILLIARHIRLSFLKPVGLSGITNIIGGVKGTVFAFIGFELITLVYPYISDKENTFKNFMYANLYTTIFYLIITATTVSYFGEELVKKLIFPVFSLFRSYKAPVFERLDLFFIAMWFSVMASSLRGYLFAAYESLEGMSHKINTKIIVVVFFAALILLSRFPKNFVDAAKYSNYLSIASLIFIGHVVISYILSFIIKKGVKQYAHKS